MQAQRPKQTIFKFIPIYQERPWGGRAIARLGKVPSLPLGKKIGESWEISDRPECESRVSNGAFQGKTIRWLLERHGSFVMGRPWKKEKRFPLLVKILDARARLSLQVHPPARAARLLGGEPKTEMWYLLGAAKGAGLLAGLKRGVGLRKPPLKGGRDAKAQFKESLLAQKLELLIHRLKVRRGDCMFMPSGRIHAMDGGCLALEIQQNSDTTYRVFDWGRVGLDGKPRPLHIQESLRCIDFNDFEPKLGSRKTSHGARRLASCGFFKAEERNLKKTFYPKPNGPSVLHVVKGRVKISSHANGTIETMRKGETVLLSAHVHEITPLGKEAKVVQTSGF